MSEDFLQANRARSLKLYSVPCLSLSDYARSLSFLVKSLRSLRLSLSFHCALLAWALKAWSSLEDAKGMAEEGPEFFGEISRCGFLMTLNVSTKIGNCTCSVETTRLDRKPRELLRTFLSGEVNGLGSAREKDISLPGGLCTRNGVYRRAARRLKVDVLNECLAVLVIVLECSRSSRPQTSGDLIEGSDELSICFDGRLL